MRETGSVAVAPYSWSSSSDPRECFLL